MGDTTLDGTIVDNNYLGNILRNSRNFEKVRFLVILLLNFQKYLASL